MPSTVIIVISVLSVLHVVSDNAGNVNLMDNRNKYDLDKCREQFGHDAVESLRRSESGRHILPAQQSVLRYL